MTHNSTKFNNTKIFVIAGGFYYFGTEIPAPEGYVALKNAAMFGGFQGGKGMPGVARGDKDATVVLDRFDPDAICTFPISACYGIIDCIDLYKFSGTTLR
jgi:hypothetical protein